MIRLTKGDEPPWFAVNKVLKTAAYKDAPQDKKPSPWRADEIVYALKQECNRKCIYCEGVIDDVSYSAVEHIKPKKFFEDLVLEWGNLGLVCWRCNTNKLDYWTEDTDLQLLDPYQDALEEHIEFRGPLTVAKLGSTRGANTVRKLRLLERDDLLFSRLRRIEELDAKLRIWHDEQRSSFKELYREDVLSAISTDREFSGVLRAYAREMGFV